MNSGLSYAFTIFNGFFIYLLFGLLLHSREPVSAQRPPWRIQDYQWDKITHNNSAVYLVEGKGGLSMLLNDSEEAILRRWGHPAFRDFSVPEKLTYTETTFTGHFILRSGFIERIIIETPRKSYESLKWLTALGLHYADIEGKSREEATIVILQKYPKARFNQTDSQLQIYSRGINFLFRKDFLRAVEIYRPYEME